MGLGSFWGCERIHVLESGSMGTEAPGLETLLDLALCASSSDCPPLFFYKKLVTITKCFG